MNVFFFNKKNATHWLALGAFVLAFLDIFFIEISTNALLLICISIIPWFVPLFKTIEIPGGIRFEMKELYDVEEKLKEAGLLKEDKKSGNIIELSDKDPNLAVAVLRIEIERELKDLVKRKKLSHVNTNRGMRNLISSLQQEEVLTNEQVGVLHDLLPSLNKAVHAENLPQEVYSWVFETGGKIISAIKNT